MSASLHEYGRNGLVTFIRNEPLGSDTDPQQIFFSLVGEHGSFYIYVATDTQLTVRTRFTNAATTKEGITETITVIEPNHNPATTIPTVLDPIVADIITGQVFASQIEVTVENTGVVPNTYLHISGYFTSI